ncbi:tRNA (adenosine(37)-N6)-threonylcarbamoyltransferase complex ATPase subunit type 1 TsaE [Patescibacteria group bacterium]|nr:tRNA (adenosine(37)-N6)-threonylcarbamoyltransferase complex ATPase subunit type 1 TsaE [Patescibacteria group bacterium]MBU1778358.1 tRNA (adenosine(37)-N6)-threonylcarbamoyltransferase complex ATPase subunit type 1 TsaE [Patescibacteria group bacterium]
MKIITNSEKETFELGKKFVKKIKPGDIIGLIGDLGAGKTIFAKGIADGLGVKQNINSPTFVIMKIYKINTSQIKQFCHIDTYRLKHAQDLINIGADEYFNQPHAVTIIEWADKILNILPKKTKFIKIKHKSESQRMVEY